MGRLDIQQKGLDLLLDHLEQAGPAMPPLQLTLVGDGPARDQLAARIAASPTLAARTRIAPWSEPASVLRGADLLLLPSRYEGVPLVMLEAMAMGVPVVASDLPGTRPFLPRRVPVPGRPPRSSVRIVESLRDPAARARVAGVNRAAFAAKASGAAFSSAVEALASRVSRWANGAPAPRCLESLGQVLDLNERVQQPRDGLQRRQDLLDGFVPAGHGGLGHEHDVARRQQE